MRAFRAPPPRQAFGAQSPGAPLVLTLLLLLIVAPAAAAQTLGGIIREEITRTPLADVEIQIVDQSSGMRVGPGLRTDPDGRFGMRLPNPGVYQVRARRVGYVAQVITDIRVDRRQERTVEVLLEIQAAKLDEVRVAAAPPRPIHLEGFEQRRRLGMGMFFTREDVERSGTTSLSNFIRGYAGVQVQSRGGRASVGNAPSSISRGCSMVLFLDGIRVNRSHDPPDVVWRSFEMIPPNHIEAVEVYRGRAQLPAEFGGPDVNCGAIIVWTRRPGLHDNNRSNGEEEQRSNQSRRGRG